MPAARRGEGALNEPVLELVMPRRLASPNLNLWKHWSHKLRETNHWLAALHLACIQVPRWQEWLVIDRIEMRKDDRGLFQPVEIRRQERRRATVIRQVKFAGHFIRDDDNLRFAVKPLNDALKRIGLLYDDSRDWLEQPMPLQEVSRDRLARTIVRIERLSEEASA